MAAKVRVTAQAGLAAQVGVAWRRTLGRTCLYVRFVRLLRRWIGQGQQQMRERTVEIRDHSTDLRLQLQ